MRCDSLKILSIGSIMATTISCTMPCSSGIEREYPGSVSMDLFRILPYMLRPIFLNSSWISSAWIRLRASAVETRKHPIISLLN